jgi:signal transduction histidine kinase
MKSRVRSLVSLGLGLLLAALPASGAKSDRVLTNAADILALTPAQAKQGLAISLTGVVTVAETTTNWRGKFFLQDATGGVFINNTNKTQPLVGDVLYVRGATHVGGYAPDIVRPAWKKVGTAPLPPAKPVTAEQLMSGSEDGQRVEVSGIVRSASRGATKLLLELASGGYRFRAFVPGTVNIDPDTLLGATVRIRGTAAASFNAPLRHILTVAMYVPQNSDFIVDHWPNAIIYQEPLTPLNGIAQYRHDGAPGRRIRVKGVVTHQRLGADVFLHDETGGLLVKCRETNSIAPGEVVEAVGFPDLEHFLPVLQDAVLVRTKETQELARPERVALQELLAGRHHSDPITLQGRLLERSVRRTGSASRPGQFTTIFSLQNSNFLFSAEVASAENLPALAAIPNGSQLEVSGICLLQMSEAGKMEAMQVLLPNADGIRILQKPSWWTPERLLLGLAVLLAILMLAITWSVTIMRRNAALRASIAAKVSAQQELQRAHDLLEWRVKERTKQLKFEMTARKEAEVQFNATLTERTRLAQELHDTLEQSLTGIKLQLDATDRLIPQQPDRATHHLGLARNMMKQSQVELRRSIWDLRSRELQQFDLCSALRAGGQQMLDGHNIELRVETEGQVRPLPEVVEENLLRMGQEALTNVVKHSGAKLVQIHLKFSPQSVTLSVQDDGRGFDPKTATGAANGHFGLVGLNERAKRLDAQLTIESAPGTGTRVAVEIPHFNGPTENHAATEDTQDVV